MASPKLWEADWFRVTEDQLRSLEVAKPALDEPWGPYSNVALAGPFFVDRKDRPAVAISLAVYPNEKAVEYYDGWGILCDVRGRVVFDNGVISFTDDKGRKIKIRKVTDADAPKIGGSTVQDIIDFYAPDTDPEEEGDE